MKTTGLGRKKVDFLNWLILGAVPASAIVIDVSGSMEPLRDRVADYVPRAHVGSWNIAELLRRVRVRIEEDSETDG